MSILVGHDIRNDLHALRLLNFKFSTSIISILDTSRIARELDVTASNLTDPLEVFQCPFDKLHCRTQTRRQYVLVKIVF
jgi:DNA polymerase III epsilon subunit-like protein